MSEPEEKPSIIEKAETSADLAQSLRKHESTPENAKKQKLTNKPS